MRCGFCGYDLDPDKAEPACGGCPLARGRRAPAGCHLVRCPRCGYEMPPEAHLVKWIRKLRQRAADRLFSMPTGLDRDAQVDEVDGKPNNGGSLTHEAE